MSQPSNLGQDARQPEWKSDRVVDPDGECLWLAVDAFPTQEAALAEARRDDPDAFAEPLGEVAFSLRWLDLEDENDVYIHDEWGAMTTVENDDNGREFWMIATHPTSPYLSDDDSGPSGHIHPPEGDHV